MIGMHVWDAVIIGGGASGLMAGLTAAKRGKSVLILEKSSVIARKLRITGGGNCNFSNLNVSSSHYLSENPHFPKSALAGYTPEEFLSLLSKHSLKWEERDNGELFAFGATYIADMLIHECVSSGAKIETGVNISGVEKTDGVFSVFAGGKIYKARNVVIAAGSVAAPQLGATDAGYRLAEQFGIQIVPVKPALAGMVLPENLAAFTSLTGITVPVSVSLRGKSFYGNLLFTHQGLSGPAAFWVSLYHREGEAVAVNFMPQCDITALLNSERKAGKTVLSVLSAVMPKKLAQIMTDGFDVRLAGASREVLTAVNERVNNFKIVPAGFLGYGKAEVASGGVSTHGLSSKTMESKIVKGLYFTGEVVDVTGELGGYNLHWAWASGFAAGKSLE